MTGVCWVVPQINAGMSAQEYRRVGHSSLAACRAECRHDDRCRCFTFDPPMLTCQLYDVDFRSTADGGEMSPRLIVGGRDEVWNFIVRFVVYINFILLFYFILFNIFNLIILSHIHAYAHKHTYMHTYIHTLY